MSNIPNNNAIFNFSNCIFNSDKRILFRNLTNQIPELQNTNNRDFLSFDNCYIDKGNIILSNVDLERVNIIQGEFNDFTIANFNYRDKSRISTNLEISQTFIFLITTVISLILLSTYLNKELSIVFCSFSFPLLMAYFLSLHQNFGIRCFTLQANEFNNNFNPTRRVNIYNLLKHLRKEISDRELENNYYYCAMHWKEKTLSWLEPEKWVNLLYKLTSGYGQSIFLPFCWWLILLLTFPFIYHYISSLPMPDDFLLSLGSSLFIVDPKSLVNCTGQCTLFEKNNLLFYSLFYLERIIQTFLLVQFGMAIRNKVKK